MPFSRSRSPESITRSATTWFARKAPVCLRMASTRVVLPWSTWATMATSRRSVRTAVWGAVRVMGIIPGMARRGVQLGWAAVCSHTRASDGRRVPCGEPTAAEDRTTVLSRDPARSRPPTDRPLDIVGLELLVCVTQALLAGLLLSLANDLGGDARAVGLPVPGLLAVLGLAVGVAWAWWLVGGSGWPLAAVDLAVALLTGALWLLSLQDTTAPHLDPLTGLIALSCAVYGIVAGVFLPGPRRGHWKGGVSQPRRGLPDDPHHARPASRRRSRRWSTSVSPTCRCRRSPCRRSACRA